MVPLFFFFLFLSGGVFDRSTQAMRMRRLILGFVLFTGVLGVEPQMSPAPSASAPVYSGIGECPLNVPDLRNHQWLIQRCQQNEQFCCQSLVDLTRILLFARLHSTGSFLLPSQRTATACFGAIRQKLDSLGMRQVPFEACNLRPEYFVSGPDQCDRIRNLSDFERAVDSSALQRYCKFSLAANNFDCTDCLNSMNVALSRLESRGGGNRGCKTFVMLYVGGGVNEYENIGPEAAYCVLISQDLVNAPNKSGGSYEHRRLRREAAVAISILAAAVVLALFVIYAVVNRSYFWGATVGRSRRFWRETQLLRESVDASTGLVFFSFATLRESTGNFSTSNVIGDGGFGTVYRGVLPDGSEIAVKRFKDFSTKGDEVFRNEVKVISNVKHRNLLPLKGYCIWGGDLNKRRPEHHHPQQQQHKHFLVYDFMANGSLADYLFKGNKPCLSWPQRHRIAVGIARGLAYLHEDAKPSIIHRDVKAANVLLDGDLNPLVADFGLAKFQEENYDRTHYTTRAVGTMGYVAPEYALYGHLTDKSDVFSFGILLLELISGRRALDSSFGRLEDINISDWAEDLMCNGKPEEVIDKRILHEYGAAGKMVERVIMLALRCSHTRVACRPSIQQALVILEAIDRPLPEIASLANIRLEERSLDSQWRWGVNWLTSPQESTVNGCHTHGNVSLNSYQSGR